MPKAKRAAKTLLVVEDHAVSREGLSILLGREGYQVVTAADGREALAHLHRGVRPCLILLDMMMPGMDGWSFLKEVRADPALVPIPVAIMAESGEREWAVSLGAVECLRKPVDVDHVLDAVRRHC